MYRISSTNQATTWLPSSRMPRITITHVTWPFLIQNLKTFTTFSNFSFQVDSSGAILNNRLRERVTIGKTERRSHVREEKQAELMQQKLAAKQSQEGVVCDNQADSASQLSVAELNTFQSTLSRVLTSHSPDGISYIFCAAQQESIQVT